VDEDDFKEIEGEREIFEFDRSLAAFDGPEIVATGLIFSFILTLPGAQTVPAAGVSWITVSPTHRRQGILTRIMGQQLDDAQARGEPLAILWASESIIYGRFGYGAASTQHNFAIDPRHGALQHQPPIDGRVRFVERERMAEVLPPIYDRYRVQQPGALTRSKGYWNLRLRDLPRHRHGASPNFALIYEGADGTPEGYALYRIKDNWELGFARNKLSINELVSTTPAARAALWRFCLQVDLIGEVTSYGAPDEALRWMLADPRRLTTKSHGDNLWVRLIDIPTALSARRYATEDRLVIGVRDNFRPDNSGAYLLEGSAAGAICRSTDKDPDIEVEVADLGAAYLGGMRFSTLAQAGRVRECTAGSLRRADLLFATERDPLCITDF
jgi:predicted acetyltransferase